MPPSLRSCRPRALRYGLPPLCLASLLTVYLLRPPEAPPVPSGAHCSTPEGLARSLAEAAARSSAVSVPPDGDALEQATAAVAAAAEPGPTDRSVIDGAVARCEAPP